MCEGVEVLTDFLILDSLILLPQNKKPYPEKRD